MARSKSKRSPQETKPNPRPLDRMRKGLQESLSNEKAGAFDNQDLDTSNTLESNHTDSVGLMEPEANLKVEPSDLVESTNVETRQETSCENESKCDDFDFLVNHQEIEAALERVDQWLAESKIEPVNSEIIEQTLEALTPQAELVEQLDTVLADYQLEQVVNQPTLSSDENRAAIATIATITPALDVDSLCQRIEATAATIERRLEELLISFESRLDARFSNLAQPMTSSSAVAQTTSLPESRPSNHSQPESASADSTWENRKRQMLSEFGMSKDEIEQMLPAGKSDKPESSHAAKLSTPQPALEALQHSIEQLDQMDGEVRSEEIDRLKQQLTSQLQAAEVELSINRAKISKEWAALEHKETEISRREAALKSKLNESDSCPKQGLLDRITRHLRKS